MLFRVKTEHQYGTYPILMESNCVSSKLLHRTLAENNDSTFLRDYFYEEEKTIVNQMIRNANILE